MKYLCLPVHGISPAVLHQVHHYLVQEFLHEGGANPEMFQCLGRDVGQLGLSSAVVTEGGVIVLAEENKGIEKLIFLQKRWCICDFQQLRKVKDMSAQSVSGKDEVFVIQVFDSQPQASPGD